MNTNEHYPKDFQEFLMQFKNEEDCWNYIFEMRWPNGYICPKCSGNNKYWLTDHKLIHCAGCGYQASVTGGTIFHGTRKPLLLWFHIMWWVVAQKTGASANNLMDFMGFGSYETAWSWLQKLRRAMVRPERDKLSGDIEVDETYIGGVEIGKGKQGRGADTKTLVVVATECIGKQIGRVRFEIIPEASSEYLMQFIENNIDTGSTVITDGWRGYSPLINNTNYKHEIKVISGSGNEAHELLPHVHLVDSLVKRWINRTHQGNISPKYLSYYLDEFAFRFNRKLSTYRGKLFYRLVQQAVDTSPKPFNELIKEACPKGISSKSYIEPYGFGPLNDLDVGKYATINMGEFWMNREMDMVQSAVSASHIYGKNVISAESFTSTPEINWKGNPAMAKNSGDLAWTYGINEFMFHRFAHQPNTHVKPGMTMGRWGFHFDPTQTWWENAGADWFKYIARGQYLLRQGVPVSDLLVFVGDGAPNSIYLRSHFEPKIPNNVNFDCVNTDVLLNRIQLKNGLMVLPEGTQYKALVLKGCEQLSLKTLKRISEISKAGIPVIGPKPTTLAGYTVAEEDKKAFANLANEIWGIANVYTDYNWNEVFKKEGITPDFSVAGRDDIKFSHRSLDYEEVYFIFNPDSVQHIFECKFRVEGKIPELWNPMTGQSHKTAQFIGDNGNTKVWIKLQAGESMFVVFREYANGIKTVAEPAKFAKTEYHLEKNNKIRSISKSKIAPLKIEGEWEVEFLKENDYAAKHIFPILTDWKDDKNENIKYYSGTAVYRKSFSVDKKFLKMKNQYWLNLGDVKIVAEVILNGQKVGVDWMPPFIMDVTKYLKSDENQSEIRVTNQWSNRLIGDERYAAIPMEKVGSNNYEMADWYVNNETAPESKRTTFSTAQFYKKTDDLMPSGLIGPVNIEVKSQMKQ